MRVDTTALRWFQQVADGATVTEVSGLERISQPGLSRALARLEAEVGTPLLRRHGRTLRTTEAGSAFKRHADAALHELDDGLAAVEQLLDPETGAVTVAFERSMGTWLLPQLVRSFRAEHPRIAVRLHPVLPAEETSRPGTGAVDLELTSRRPGAGGRWRRLFSEPIVLVVPVGHHLGGDGAVPLAAAAEEPFVLLRNASPFRRAASDLLAAAGLEPTVAFEADDLATVQGFVAAGLGVSLVPASVVADRCEVVGLTDRGASRDVGLVWSEQRPMLPAAVLLRDHVLTEAGHGHLAVPFA